MSGSIRLSILGHEYKVKVKGDQGYLQELSKYIDGKVVEVQRSKTAVSTKDLIALVMLNMADEVAQARKELDELKLKADSRLEKLIDYIDTYLG